MTSCKRCTFDWRTWEKRRRVGPWRDAWPWRGTDPSRGAWPWQGAGPDNTRRQWAEQLLPETPISGVSTGHWRQ